MFDMKIDTRRVLGVESARGGGDGKRKTLKMMLARSRTAAFWTSDYVERTKITTTTSSRKTFPTPTLANFSLNSPQNIDEDAVLALASALNTTTSEAASNKNMKKIPSEHEASKKL
jgi:hypothetical protein